LYLNFQRQGHFAQECYDPLYYFPIDELCCSNLDSATEDDNIHPGIYQAKKPTEKAVVDKHLSSKSDLFKASDNKFSHALDQTMCASQENIIDSNQHRSLERSSEEHLTKQGTSVFNFKCCFESMHVSLLYLYDCSNGTRSKFIFKSCINTYQLYQYIDCHEIRIKIIRSC